VVRTIYIAIVCVLCGCAGHTHITYHTAIDVAPTDEEGRHEVTGHIIEVNRFRRGGLVSRSGQKTQVLTIPTMTINAGEPVEVSIDSEDGTESLKLSVTHAPAEDQDGRYSLVLQRGNKIVAGSIVTIHAEPPKDPTIRPEGP